MAQIGKTTMDVELRIVGVTFDCIPQSTSVEPASPDNQQTVPISKMLELVTLLRELQTSWRNTDPVTQLSTVAAADRLTLIINYAESSVLRGISPFAPLEESG